MTVIKIVIMARRTCLLSSNQDSHVKCLSWFVLVLCLFYAVNDRGLPAQAVRLCVFGTCCPRYTGIMHDFDQQGPGGQTHIWVTVCL